MPSPEFFVKILKKHFGDDYQQIYGSSHLLQYLSKKTKSVDRSSKSRANLGNLYAIYVLIEDYIKKGYNIQGDYTKYNGANFTDLFRRQRELPGGQKLQNHHLNHRCNQEFRKFFQGTEDLPIIRRGTKYWINENLLKVPLKTTTKNIAECIIDIVDSYSSLRQQKFQSFFQKCMELKVKLDEEDIFKFVKLQLKPEVDARIFEIVSFCILKNYYALKQLTLYKTGRTNANDGGIDFVMRPPGRFFQVSEEIDFRKYFLDIDKILRFPITFVMKFSETPDDLKTKIIHEAQTHYSAQVLAKYIEAIEEIISIPTLLSYLEDVIKNGKSEQLLDDLVLYYKVEFNISTD